VEPSPAQMVELADLLEALLREIADAGRHRERGERSVHEQDHR
jgi:hypothetical protein